MQRCQLIDSFNGGLTFSSKPCKSPFPPRYCRQFYERCMDRSQVVSLGGSVKPRRKRLNASTCCLCSFSMR